MATTFRERLQAEAARRAEIGKQRQQAIGLPDQDKVSSSIEALIESAKNKTEMEENKDLHFMRFLNESKRNRIENAPEVDDIPGPIGLVPSRSTGGLPNVL